MLLLLLLLPFYSYPLPLISFSSILKGIIYRKEAILTQGILKTVASPPMQTSACKKTAKTGAPTPPSPPQFPLSNNSIPSNHVP